MKTKLRLSWAILLSTTLIASGCINSLYVQMLPFKYNIVSDRLLSGNVTTLFQNSRGYLWIGRVEGLSMYDGTSFKNYTQEDGLENSYVTAIA